MPEYSGFKRGMVASMPAHVLIESLERMPTVEVAFRVAWDIEHTVATRFQNWQFIELNGSVRGI
jgi:hypothetical protein